MSNAKAEREELLNVVVPFAKDMLVKHGEFYPMGAAMKMDGEIVLAMVDLDEGDANVEEDIRAMKDGFIEGARAGEYKATALAYNVTVILPASGEKSDAIAVALDHRDGYSAVACFPYRFDGDEVIVDAAIGQPGDGEIFPQ